VKILRVIASINPETGGPIEGIVQISRALNRAGHVDEIACLDRPGSPWLKESALVVHALGPGIFNYRYTPKLVSWLKRNVYNYDAVIIHGLWQFSGLGTWIALKKSRCPYFVYPHGMLDPWFNERYPLKRIKKTPYWWIVERNVLKDAKAVLFTSEEERQQAKKSFPGYSCRENVVKYGTKGADEDFDKPDRRFHDRYPFLKDKKVFLFLSRIHPKKGIDLLLRAFAQSKDKESHLIIAGPDKIGWKKRLMTISDQLGISTDNKHVSAISPQTKNGG